MERMVSHTKLTRFAFKIGFPHWHHGGDSNSKIWLLWKTDWEVEPVAHSEQAIHIKVRLRFTPVILAFSIYANCLKRI